MLHEPIFRTADGMDQHVSLIAFSTRALSYGHIISKDVSAVGVDWLPPSPPLADAYDPSGECRRANNCGGDRDGQQVYFRR